LIELLLVVAILSTMVTVGIAGFNASRTSISTFAAARDVMSIVRRARSVALVTQRSVVVEYSIDRIDDEVCAKVEIHSEKLFKNKSAAVEIRNLDGEVVSDGEEAPSGDANSQEGETLADVLSPKGISADVARGLRIRASANKLENFFSPDEVKQSKISIYSTADSVKRSYAPSEQSTAAPSTSSTASGAEESGEDESADDPFEAVFAANGTVDPPHRIWIYPDGSTPDKGLCITVDRFGEPRCEEVDVR
jgi:hypothetical protein